MENHPRESPTVLRGQAEILEADERELDRLAHALTAADAAFALGLVGEVIVETTGGQACTSVE